MSQLCECRIVECHVCGTRLPECAHEEIIIEDVNGRALEADEDFIYLCSPRCVDDFNEQATGEECYRCKCPILEHHRHEDGSRVYCSTNCLDADEDEAYSAAMDDKLHAMREEGYF